MNILILGSGGREHAFSWKIAQSPLCSNLYIAPGNAGSGQSGINVSLNILDFEQIATFCLEHQIDLLLPGSEDPLVHGIVDYFKSREDLKNILVAGPVKEGAQLEGSKDFAKAFMARHEIPTAAYQTFTKDTLEQGYAFLETLQPPYVLKADGLAAGKGVVIPETLEEAKKELHSMLAEAKFGEASSRVVIEEFLKGIEVSVFVLTDGKDYFLLPEAKDYKRIGEGDTGLNTGGMGAISPVPFVNETFLNKVEERIVKPTIAGLQKENIDYKGFIFLGLMNVGGDPYVIEYNVRMGDPETEAVLPRIKSDLLELLEAVCKQTLASKSISITPQTAATVVLVSGGYPESYPKGKAVSGLHGGKSLVFHAGTKNEGGKCLTNGGRVFAITSLADNLQEALKMSFEKAQEIEFEGKYYRRDIGQDLLKLSQS
ncbi:MAG: phosphoribosylamine--glycine ligase [Bacteroidota bacterium]|nr:phosphoribosylamine--glycine ligase [Bacteroidota bacterium]MDX5429591.1 phosphoribosylamine--glycine ligase [Bacteroidota bacterium]MDX5468375.1 phosphoribosylamine--glycine ligase [Bacteroidota bacterium]